MKTAPQRPGRARYFQYVRWVAAIALLLWIGIRHGDVFHTIHETSLEVSLFAAAIGLTLLSQLAMSFRWYCLFPRLATATPAIAACQQSFLAAISNYSPLGDYGGMTIRVAFLIRRGCPRVRDAFLSVFLDRALGLASLILMSCIAFSIGRNQFRDEFAPALHVFQLMTISGLTAALAIYVLCSHRGIQELRLVKSFHQRITQTLAHLMHQRRRAAFAVCWTLVSQSCAVLALTCVAASVAQGQYAPGLIENAVILPIVELSAIVFPTPSGIGVREFAMSQLYYIAAPDLTMNAATRLGLTVAIASRLATFLSTLLGLLGTSIVLRHGRNRNDPTSLSSDDPLSLSLNQVSVQPRASAAKTKNN